MKLICLCLLLVSKIAIAQNIPPKAELDAIIQNAAKQMNSQMSGLRIDDYTTLK